MNTQIVQIKRALLSVSNKSGVTEFAQELHQLDIEIISTGGTAKLLREAGIPVADVSQFTGFPEIMAGRVKTLHPLVHGGILGWRDIHSDVAAQQNIKWIDLVVCNFYPFAETIQKPNISEDEIIENIDIGGPTMIRSAAKNVGWVGVVVDPNDYQPILKELNTHGGLTFPTRKQLSVKAFGHTAQYDSIIYKHFVTKVLRPDNEFPNTITLPYLKLFDLRYGENPHQKAAAYVDSFPLPRGRIEGGEISILEAKILQGKQLSYNNINDADGALNLIREFSEPACAIIKHANPCGVATNSDLTEAFKLAYNADPVSAFGGIIALNHPCTKEIAKEINKIFVEIVIAPTFQPDALTILEAKKNLRLLEIGDIYPPSPSLEYRFVTGGLLVQESDTKTITREDLKVVTAKQPTDQEIETMLFAWKVVKHMKSNAILVAKEKTTVGIGVGQVSRVDAVDIAIKKSGNKITGSILASDAFFPFRDSIDKLAGAGLTAIIQPGGSIKDDEVIKACHEHGIAMVFTGVRAFKH